MGPPELVIMLLVVVIGILGTIFWIWMLVDCLTKESNQGNGKVARAVVVAVTYLIGPAIYSFVRQPKRMAEADA
jgi:Na+/pantothenate symporter